jgi:hypothetical protein
MVMVSLMFVYPMIFGGIVNTTMNIEFLDHEIQVLDNYTNTDQPIGGFISFLYRHFQPNYGVKPSTFDTDRLF